MTIKEILNFFNKKPLIVHDGVFKIKDDGLYCPKGSNPTFMPHGLVIDGEADWYFYSNATEEEIIETFLTKNVTSLIGGLIWDGYDSDVVPMTFIQPTQLVCRIWAGKDYPVSTALSELPEI